MSSASTAIKDNLGRVKDILDLCGAGRAALVEFGPDSPGGDIQLLVEIAPGRSLLDIIPAEEQLSALLERPVILIPEQSLHPDQARRLRGSARPI